MEAANKTNHIVILIKNYYVAIGQKLREYLMPSTNWSMDTKNLR